MIKICAACGRAFESAYPKAVTCGRPECRKAHRKAYDRERNRQRSQDKPKPAKPTVPPGERACRRRKMDEMPICYPCEGECDTCGWNPEVERERLKALRVPGLKPCPMCAGAAAYEYSAALLSEHVRARCAVCKLSTAWYDDVFGAAGAWNKRREEREP